MRLLRLTFCVLALAGCAAKKEPFPTDCPGCGETIVPPPDRYR